MYEHSNVKNTVFRDAVLLLNDAVLPMKDLKNSPRLN